METPLTLHYAGYAGSVKFDPADDVYYGEVLGISDSIAFEGRTIPDLQKSFETEIDDYLAFCEKIGKVPDRPSDSRTSAY